MANIWFVKVEVKKNCTVAVVQIHLADRATLDQLTIRLNPGLNQEKNECSEIKEEPFYFFF